MPPDERSGPEGPPQGSAVPQIDSIVPDQDDHRRRQIRRLATIALVRSFYGPGADARLMPPGPDCCPDHCPYCNGAA
jgi:hypothetical protein